MIWSMEDGTYVKLLSLGEIREKHPDQMLVCVVTGMRSRAEEVIEMYRESMALQHGFTVWGVKLLPLSRQEIEAMAMADTPAYSTVVSLLNGSSMSLRDVYTLYLEISPAYPTVRDPSHHGAVNAEGYTNWAIESGMWMRRRRPAHTQTSTESVLPGEET